MNARHSTILRMRNECRTTKEMAIALNTTPRAIKASISHMRKSGIKVPIGGQIVKKLSVTLRQSVYKGLGDNPEATAKKLLDIIVRDNMIDAILDGE